MTGDDATLSLIEAIYEAALDETRWRAVMERLVTLTATQGATFCILHGAGEPRFSTFEYINFDPVFAGEYLDFMMPHDPTIQYLLAHPQARLFHDSTYISEREKDRLAYYDWHHRHSATRHRMGGMINPGPSVQSGITLHRTRARGDFEPETVAHFAGLFRHVERALEIGFRLGTLGSLQQVSAELLDHNPLAIILLDAGGAVILANRAARELAEAGDGLTLARDGLALRQPHDNQKLQRLVGDALSAASVADAVPGGVMLALRPSGRRPYSILVSPLARGSFALTRLRPSACIVIADPETREVLPLDRLRALYGLTRAEARLAAKIAAGEALRSAATALGIAYPTARTQLAAIFRKTETRRQGELASLLLQTVTLLAP